MRKLWGIDPLSCRSSILSTKFRVRGSVSPKLPSQPIRNPGAGDTATRVYRKFSGWIIIFSQNLVQTNLVSMCRSPLNGRRGLNREMGPSPVLRPLIEFGAEDRLGGCR